MGSVTGMYVLESEQKSGNKTQDILIYHSKWATSNQNIPILVLAFVDTFGSHQDEERRPRATPHAHFCIYWCSYLLPFPHTDVPFYTRRAVRGGGAAQVSFRSDCGVGRLCNCGLGLESFVPSRELRLSSLSPITLHFSLQLTDCPRTQPHPIFPLFHPHPHITPSHTMARDRLAAMRVSHCHVQPTADLLIVVFFRPSRLRATSMSRLNFSLGVGLSHSFNSSYPTQRTGNDGGYSRRQNPYAQQDDDPSYEMADVVNPSTTHLTSNMAGDSLSPFYDEVLPLHRISNTLS